MSELITQPPPQNNVSTWLSPSSFEAAEKIAALMGKCGTLPAHLVGKPADCFRIVVQAAKWGMDPFQVAECTSLVHGRMCYEGKLIASILHSMNALEGRLEYQVEGEGQRSKITISGRPKGAKKECVLVGTVEQWRTHTTNKEGRAIPNNWDKDPHSMLVYRGTRQWARLYAPGAIMGIYTPDEFDQTIDVTAQSVVHDSQVQVTASAQPAPIAEKPKVHPAIEAGRTLYSECNKKQEGLGAKVIAKICLSFKVPKITDIPPDKLEELGKLIDVLMQDPANALNDIMVSQ
jgi:hypothetical protein